MKKIVIILLIFFSFNVVNASVTTYERSENDYRVHESIKVNGNNIDNIMNTPSVDENEKVYDFADLLSEIEEKSLYNEVLRYINEFNMDMIILTIDNNTKGTAKKYAEDFYDYNYFGIGNSFDGILFIVDMDTREIYILTTGNAIIMYDDDRIDDILDSSYNYISKRNYFDTCRVFIKDSYNYALKGIHDSNENVYIDSEGNLYVDNDIPYFKCFIISVVLTLIGILIMINMNKLVVKKANVHNNLVDETLKIDKMGQSLINTYTTCTRISKSSSSFASSRVGGSSISRGSSGRSHGGGGRKF